MRDWISNSQFWCSVVCLEKITESTFCLFWKIPEIESTNPCKQVASWIRGPAGGRVVAKCSVILAKDMMPPTQWCTQAPTRPCAHICCWLWEKNRFFSIQADMKLKEQIHSQKMIWALKIIVRGKWLLSSLTKRIFLMWKEGKVRQGRS